jgi:methionine synthase I (cobalamin-dependent)
MTRRIAHDRLADHLPSVTIVGGCRGTDARHVRAPARVPLWL